MTGGLTVCHSNPLFADCLVAAISARTDLSGRTVAPDSRWPETNGFPSTVLLIADARISLPSLGNFTGAVRRESGKTILLSRPPQPILPLANLKVDGWVTEDAPLSELLIAADAVLSGDRYCSPELAIRLVDEVQNSGHVGQVESHEELSVLTPREKVVLRHLLEGDLSNKELAKMLNLSIYTIKNHVHHILEKLGTRTRHEAVTRGLQHGWANFL